MKFRTKAKIVFATAAACSIGIAGAVAGEHGRQEARRTHQSAVALREWLQTSGVSVNVGGLAVNGCTSAKHPVSLPVRALGEGEQQALSGGLGSDDAAPAHQSFFDGGRNHGPTAMATKQTLGSGTLRLAVGSTGTEGAPSAVTVQVCRTNGDAANPAFTVELTGQSTQVDYKRLTVLMAAEQHTSA